MIEEQFVALFYTIGVFRDIGNEEEKLYNDLLKIITIKEDDI